MTRYKAIEAEVKTKIEETKRMKRTSKTKRAQDVKQTQVDANLEMAKQPSPYTLKTKKKAAKKDNRFSVKWLLEVLNGTPDAETVALGSNVVEIRLVGNVNDSLFAEGGILRIMMDILLDSDSEVKLVKVYVPELGSPRYRLSTRVK